MALQTSIANTLDHAGDEAKLDSSAKKIFSHEAILAPMMRMCVPEFAAFPDEYIIANCFAGPPQVSSWPVHQDEGTPLDGDQRIVQMNSEESASGERTIHYDIRFSAKVPGSDGQQIGLIINVELQAEDQLKYHLVTRGLYYCARMISAQYGTVFTKSDYQKLQKVYSIWICPDSASGKHSVTEYRIQETLRLGDNPAEPKDYDKLQVIIITLGPEGTSSENPLIRFLSLLLSTDLPLESRKEQLKNEYRIQMNRSLEEEMSTVCNLGEGIARRSYAEGVSKGMAQGVAQGLAQGVTKGEDRMAVLFSKLIQSGRVEDAFRAAEDPVYRNKLFMEFQLNDIAALKK